MLINNLILGRRFCYDQNIRRSNQTALTKKALLVDKQFLNSISYFYKTFSIYVKTNFAITSLYLLSQNDPIPSISVRLKKVLSQSYLSHSFFFARLFVSKWQIHFFFTFLSKISDLLRIMKNKNAK